MKRLRRLILSLCFVILAGGDSAQSGLIINLNFLGGAAPTLTGSGSLQSTVGSAARVWELAFNDSSFDHTLSIDYAWTSLSGGTLASHSLLSQGGTPNRETAGRILFDNSGRSFFADGTLDSSDPIGSGNSEYTNFSETSGDYGGGVINNGRVFTGATGEAAGEYDLYTIALHEIGHALGLSSANFSYRDETWVDNDIDVGGNLPFSGSVLPTNNSGPVPPGSSNAHLRINTALLYPSIGRGIRRLPSAVDILANAQLSQFTNPNLDMDMMTVPEPGQMLMLVAASVLVFFRTRRRH